MKNIIFCCALMCAAGALFAQNEKSITVYGIRGPSGVSLVHFMDVPPVIAGYKVNTEIISGADIMAAEIIAGKIQIGFLPANVAAKIASGGKKIQVAAVTGNGMLSIITDDKSVKKIEDLKGKDVYCSGQGATPEFVFRQILRAKGIDPDKDINLIFSLAYPEAAQSLIAGRVHFVLLPEPFATMALSGNKKLHTVGDVQKEWIALSGDNYPMTVLVVNSDFAAANKAAVNAVLNGIWTSSDWVTKNPRDAAALAEKYDLGLKKDVIERAIPKSNYVYIPAAMARPALEALFRVFLENAPASIGGKLPANNFYYEP